MAITGRGQLGERRLMDAPRLFELLAVRAERLDHRGMHRAFEIFCAAGIDLTMRFADLLPPGGGPGLEFGFLKSMKVEHQSTLLKIADAWDRVAEERERQGGKEEREKKK